MRKILLITLPIFLTISFATLSFGVGDALVDYKKKKTEEIDALLHKIAFQAETLQEATDYAIRASELLSSVDLADLISPVQTTRVLNVYYQGVYLGNITVPSQESASMVELENTFPYHIKKVDNENRIISM
jgi:hypothetical protein